MLIEAGINAVLRSLKEEEYHELKANLDYRV